MAFPFLKFALNMSTLMLFSAGLCARLNINGSVCVPLQVAQSGVHRNL